jgi:hypothetical protein
MTLVEQLRIATAEIAHAETQVRFDCLDDQMEMVVQKAVAQALPAAIHRRLQKQPKESRAIVRVKEDRLAVIPSLPDVMDAARKLRTRSTWHVQLQAGPSAASPLKGKGSVPFSW